MDLAAALLHHGVLLPNRAMMSMVDREVKGEGAESPLLPATPKRRYVYTTNYVYTRHFTRYQYGV